MWRSEYALYLGKEDEAKLTEFFAADRFFFIIQYNEPKLKPEVPQIVKTVYNRLIDEKPQHLADFNQIVSETITADIHTKEFSFACGLIVSQVIYIKTQGNTTIFLEREKKLASIISGDNTASGYIKDGDLFIFANASFVQLLEADELGNSAVAKLPQEIVDEFESVLKDKDNRGAIALFVLIRQELSLSTETAQTMIVNQVEKTPNKISFLSKLKSAPTEFLSRINLSQNETIKNKRTTIILLAVLFLILIWSIIFGAKRRARAQLMKQVNVVGELIEQKLEEAADVAILNLDRSQALLKEARQEVVALKKQAGKQSIPEIQKLEENIAQSEKTIIKRENRKAEIFYDLGLIEKGATASAFYKDGDKVVLLNNLAGKIYLIHLEKKSVTTIKKEEIKGANLIALHNDSTFFFQKDRGVLKIDNDNKLSIAVVKDDQWGIIADLKIYNGNIYLLDSNKDEIYKYTVTANGYSTKNSYLKSGQSINIPDDGSIAIDSAVYISLSDRINKYTGGTREEFNVSFPDNNLHSFTEIFTDKDTAKLYVLDKTKAKLFVVSKTGQYEKQIESSVLREVNNFVVYDPTKSIYLLKTDKIYQLAL